MKINNILQLGPKKVIPVELIEDKWKALALPQEKLDDLVRIGAFSGDTEWLKFFSLAASALNDVSHNQPNKWILKRLHKK